jgi:hypothetical protein
MTAEEQDTLSSVMAGVEEMEEEEEEVVVVEVAHVMCTGEAVLSGEKEQQHVRSEDNVATRGNDVDGK